VGRSYSHAATGSMGLIPYIGTSHRLRCGDPRLPPAQPSDDGAVTRSLARGGSQSCARYYKSEGRDAPSRSGVALSHLAAGSRELSRPSFGYRWRTAPRYSFMQMALGFRLLSRVTGMNLPLREPIR
jgi:hypothetical protein